MSYITALGKGVVGSYFEGLSRSRRNTIAGAVYARISALVNRSCEVDMNYPIWEVSGSGLLIAAMAIIHVFISHYAVGGGFFLLALEWKARREEDTNLLEFVRRHSRIFILLSLVLGAVTGVGIWFTIGLVNPQATSTLIQTFVWIWAIEWVFFVTEIAAALIYYYGWSRLRPGTHLAVAAIYAVSAWMSLFVINGILSFMLTPGDWIISRDITAAFFNPTFWPSLLGRTLIAIGLAGLYAILTASFLKDSTLKEKVTRYAALRWVGPAALLIPLSVVWYLSAVASTASAVEEVFGVQGGSFLSVFESILSGSGSGYPFAQTAAFASLSASLILALVLSVVFWRGRRLKPAVSFLLLGCGFVAFGGGEWVREDLRKPYVIGQYMFVNGVRLPSNDAVKKQYPTEKLIQEDPFNLEKVKEQGVLKTALWIDKNQTLADTEEADSSSIRQGKLVFKLLCSTCHTISGHLGISPLVEGHSRNSVRAVISALSQPVSRSMQAVSWSDPALRIRSWRGRRMPPFAGTAEELESLASFLLSLNDTSTSDYEQAVGGQKIFEERCIFCHGSNADWAMQRLAAGKSESHFFETIGRLPSVSPIMPPFEGTDEDRRMLALYLAEFVRNGLRENVR